MQPLPSTDVEIICGDESWIGGKLQNKMIELIENTIPKNIKNVGIKMSGGTDSSIAAYLIALYSVKNNLNLNIIPITVIEESAPFQLIFTETVIKIINKIISANIKQPIVFNFSKGDKIKRIRKVENILFKSKTVELIVSGTTKAPKEDIGYNNTVKWPASDDRTLDSYPYLWDNKIYTPILNIDKKGVAKLYEEYDLVDTLFPYTRSCVSATTDFSKHCGTCWWCKERIWAFGRLQ